MLSATLAAVRCRPVLVLLAAALLFLELWARQVGGPPPSLALVRNPFAAIAAATVFCRYLISDRRGPVRKTIVCLAPLAVAAAVVLEGRGAPTQLLLMDVLTGLGAIGVLGYVLAARRAGAGQDRERYLGQLMDALIVPAGASMASFGLWSTGRINPVYDGRVYAFEEILGFKFSLLGVQSYRLLAPLSAAATACYGILPLAIALVAAAQKDPQREQGLLTATVVAGAAGFAMYFYCPVAGPLHAFSPLYPNALPPISADAALITAPLGPPRNGMPSLHTVWALLVWFNIRELPTLARWALRAFVAFTLWAVMGLDDTHWFLDAVVAVPFAVALQLAFVSGRAEGWQSCWRVVLACSALTVVWLVTLRTGSLLFSLPPAGAWAAVVATVWWPMRRERTVVELSTRPAERIASAEALRLPG
jgi:hypothetical protein